MLKKSNKEIKITREEFVTKFMGVIANPFKGMEDMPEDEKAQMQFSIMMHGMLLLKNMEKELFGEE